MHVSVLGPEAVAFLGIKPDGVYLDATGGGGGHSELILNGLDQRGRLIISDRDPEAIFLLKERFGNDPRCRVIRARFSELFEILQSETRFPLNGVLADFGLSSIQMDHPERSFSFRSNAPLDMRMSPDEDKSLADLLNDVTERDLADVLYYYGEERRSRIMARAILAAQKKGELYSANQLGRLAEKVLGGVARRMKIHPATKTFQALRIWVNDEMEELEALLDALPKLIKPGGRVAMISFHSLEDRKLKLRFQALKKEGWIILTKKPVTPGENEIGENPRSRSAKLRAIGKGEEQCREY